MNSFKTRKKNINEAMNFIDILQKSIKDELKNKDINIKEDSHYLINLLEIIPLLRNVDFQYFSDNDLEEFKDYCEYLANYEISDSNITSINIASNTVADNESKDITRVDLSKFEGFLDDRTVRLNGSFHKFFKIHCAKSDKNGNVKEHVDRAVHEYIMKYFPGEFYDNTNLHNHKLG